jgi:hypothetical protein
VPSKYSKNFPQVPHMIRALDAFDNHIINIHFNSLPKQLREHFSDHSLVNCPGILQSERHYLVAEYSSGCDERGLFLVFFSQGDLVVPLESIQEAHSLVAGHRVHQLIYLREWERVFWASFVQICKIYTDPPLSVFLLYNDGVGQPLWVQNFPNRSNLQEPFYFFSHGLGKLWCCPSCSLDYWFVLGRNVQFVADKF